MPLFKKRRNKSQTHHQEAISIKVKCSHIGNEHSPDCFEGRRIYAQAPDFEEQIRSVIDKLYVAPVEIKVLSVDTSQIKLTFTLPITHVNGSGKLFPDQPSDVSADVIITLSEGSYIEVGYFLGFLLAGALNAICHEYAEGVSFEGQSIFNPHSYEGFFPSIEYLPSLA